MARIRLQENILTHDETSQNCIIVFVIRQVACSRKHNLATAYDMSGSSIPRSSRDSRATNPRCRYRRNDRSPYRQREYFPKRLQNPLFVHVARYPFSQSPVMLLPSTIAKDTQPHSKPLRQSESSDCPTQYSSSSTHHAYLPSPATPASSPAGPASTSLHSPN